MRTSQHRAVERRPARACRRDSRRTSTFDGELLCHFGKVDRLLCDELEVRVS